MLNIFRSLKKKYIIITLIISTKKAPRISRGFFIFNQTSYALFALCFFAFGSEPNGLFFAKSTNTGAATKIEE